MDELFKNQVIDLLTSINDHLSEIRSESEAIEKSASSADFHLSMLRIDAESIDSTLSSIDINTH